MDEFTAIKERLPNIKNNFIRAILGFAKFLRQHDYSVSTPALIDFFTLVPEYDIFQFDDMIITMRSLFAKSRMEYLEFENLMKEYFFENANEKITHISKKYKQNVQKMLEEERKKEVSIKRRKDTEEKTLAEEAKENESVIENILNEAHAQDIKPILMFNEQEMIDMVKNIDIENIKKLFNRAMLYNISHDNNPLFNKLCIKAADVFTKVNEKVKKELKERAKQLKEIEKLLTEQHRPEFFTGYRAVKMINEIADKAITSLSEEEYERLSEYIRLNSAKFRTRISRSVKQAKSKQFDFKKTVQKSVQTFGVPFKLYYKKPIVKKTRIVCILDVSGSVIKYAQLFLQFIYELSSVFVDGVKSYVFVGDIDDITEYMTRYPLKEASKLATSAANISYRAYSDYNRAFRQFCDKYLGFVDRHTVVIILGDARNNKNESGLEYLYQIKKRAKTVLWLNPEKQSKWDTGDSIISRYKPHIDGLYQVTTFNELVSFLERVVI